MASPSCVGAIVRGLGVPYAGGYSPTAAEAQTSARHSGYEYRIHDYCPVGFSLARYGTCWVMDEYPGANVRWRERPTGFLWLGSTQWKRVKSYCGKDC